MKTDQFIDLLAKDQVVEKLPKLGLYYLAGALLLLGYTYYLYASSGMGVRADYSESIVHFLVAVKQILPLGLAFLAFPFLRELLYPETRWKQRMRLPVTLYVASMVALFVYAWVTTEPELRMMAFVGKSSVKCLVTIPIYSFLVMLITFIPMRKFAPGDPKHAAMMGAVVAVGISAAIYAFGCDEDSPLFYAVWYNVGMTFAALVGGFFGYKLLKW